VPRRDLFGAPPQFRRDVDQSGPPVRDRRVGEGGAGALEGGEGLVKRAFMWIGIEHAHVLER